MFETICTEFKVAWANLLIMHDGSNVYHDVLRAKILQYWELLCTLFMLVSSKVNDWIDDLNEFIVCISHDEGSHAPDLEVEVVDQVSLLIEVLCGRE